MPLLRVAPQPPTPALIKALIEDHAGQVQAYLRFQDYYEAKHHGILDRKRPDTSKPDNRLVNNFPGYIVDVSVGYFLGKPVVYTAQDADFMKTLQDAFNQNDEADENLELAKVAGIKGAAFEILYVDDQARPRFGVVKPEQVILAYDTTIDPEPSLALRYYTVTDPVSGKERIRLEYYTATQVYQYEMDGPKGTPALVGKPRPHPFGAVPIIEFPNNDERQADFERVLSLVDAYDASQSDTGNDFQYHTDAYLRLKNLSGTTEKNLADMKRDRVILLDGDGEADWLLKQINDTALENYKNRLQGDIHRFSQTPSLTDESFAGNLSGVAIQYKLWGLEQRAVQKERKFKKALQRRIRLLANFFRVKGRDFDWRDVSLTFTRNVPQNVQELAEVVSSLKGTVSDETLLALLPFIENVEEELTRLEVQNKGLVDLDAFGKEAGEGEGEGEEEGEETGEAAP